MLKNPKDLGFAAGALAGAGLSYLLAHQSGMSISESLQASVQLPYSLAALTTASLGYMGGWAKEALHDANTPRVPEYARLQPHSESPVTIDVEFEPVLGSKGEHVRRYPLIEK